MSPVKQMNAGLTSAMACTRAARTAGFAASVSMGSWKRVSPYAMKRNGDFTSRRKSAGEDCAFDFFMQPIIATSVIVANNTITVCAKGGCRAVMLKVSLSESDLLSHDQRLERPISGGNSRWSACQTENTLQRGFILGMTLDGAPEICLKTQPSISAEGTSPGGDRTILSSQFCWSMTQ